MTKWNVVPPLIVTHGWPGSIIEPIKIIDPLTDPTSFGGKVEDSFDIVRPQSARSGRSATKIHRLKATFSPVPISGAC